MKLTKLFVLITFVFFNLLTSSSLKSQILEPVKWSYELRKLENNQIDIVLTAKIDEGWSLYAQDVPPGGPLPTEIKFSKSPNYSLAGRTTAAPKAKEVFDTTFEMLIGKWTNQVRFTQRINIIAPQNFNIDVNIDYMVCNEESCIPLSDNLTIKVVGQNFFVQTTEQTTIVDTTEAQIEQIEETDTLKNVETTAVQKSDTEESKAPWFVFWLGIVGGLLALLTPCVWPIIPMTVSFFLNKSQTKRKSIRDASFFGLSIVVVYVLLGLGISLIFGAAALQNLATSPIFNIFFFLLLVVFAISFFGAFELTMPSKWVNAMDKKSEKSSGLLGVFFMGLTLALVSFSCTGPIVGALLVEAAASGSFVSPMLGMLGFSLAIAIPFSILAIFPSLLKSMPKSGGWMNSVKVVLAFLMLAFSLRFFVIADSVAGWNILTRDAFIAIWIVIFVLMGLYLIGKIKFSHDSDLKHLGITRLFFAITSFTIALILLPGLWGAPLKFISGFTPSLSTQDFNIANRVSVTANMPDLSKYENYNIKKLDNGIIKFLDYNEGLEFAAKHKKPIFLDFSGIGCTNCKKMEASVWSDPLVLPMLVNDFVVITLYTDDRTELPEDQQFVSNFGGRERKIRTIGQKWGNLQASVYGVNAQPYYVLLNNKEQMLVEPSGAEFNVNKFADFLKKGLEEYRRQKAD